MTQEEYDRDHPDLDWEKVYDACLYALQHLYIAELKENEDAPCAAEEHRSMVFRKLRDAIKTARN